ncbi:MAG TPA: hypothetical protein VHE34_21585 [Puia sp.]|uniref:hypothetical protein n=1 Tax=Puia sp. TaxID=2045100 RepID=UPI002CA13BB4|nr:hypothetical protein [Puia sp.]HVU97837.1 hypothetical protein [Puia sp.]
MSRLWPSATEEMNELACSGGRPIARRCWLTSRRISPDTEAAGGGAEAAGGGVEAAAGGAEAAGGGVEAAAGGVEAAGGRDTAVCGGEKNAKEMGINRKRTA